MAHSSATWPCPHSNPARPVPKVPSPGLFQLSGEAKGASALTRGTTPLLPTQCPTEAATGLLCGPGQIHLPWTCPTSGPYKLWATRPGSKASWFLAQTCSVANRLVLPGHTAPWQGSKGRLGIWDRWAWPAARAGDAALCLVPNVTSAYAALPAGPWRVPWQHPVVGGGWILLLLVRVGLWELKAVGNCPGGREAV